MKSRIMKEQRYERPPPEELELEILDLGEGMQGFARHPDGRAIWVSGALAPGDLVRVRTGRQRGNSLHARLLEIIAPAPQRVDPPCPYYGQCGGCTRQHLAYTAQLEFKRKAVAAALRQIARIANPPVGECVGAEEAYGYRNKIDLSFTEPRRRNEAWQLGYHALSQGRPVIDIDHCLLAPPIMSEVAVMLREFLRERQVPAWQSARRKGLLRSLVLRRSVADGTLLVNLVTGRYRAELMKELGRAMQERFPGLIESFVNSVITHPSSSAPPDELRTIFGSGALREVIGGCEFRVSPNAFLQVNLAQCERLYAAVLAAGGIGADDKVLDLYCGAGTLTLLAARQASAVLGIEAHPEAIVDAEANAARLGVENARFERRDLARGLGPLPFRPDIIIADPPRGGLDATCLGAIAELTPRKLIYVSCHPGALARDCAILAEKGFRLETLSPFDLFPQTHHVESLAVFSQAWNTGSGDRPEWH
jgi:23S rRNA (uracil1939-C5)-methyltransferase